jgi:hypothetical protein
MIAAPMLMPRHAAPRLAPLRRASARSATRALVTLAAASLLLAACGSADPTGPSNASFPVSAPASTPLSTPMSTPTPVPTPSPSPSFTNPPDAALEAVIPDVAAGSTVVKPAPDQYGMTPGDIAPAYGEIGNRFRSLAVAYVEPRKLSLYAMRLDGAPVTTAALRPYLATAGRYVGIAGLHPEAWKRTTVGGNVVWVRPEDNATAAGTMIYTWAAQDYVFLMIGTDAKINAAMLAALPGEAAPTPSPAPSRSPGASGSPQASASASASPSASPAP